MPPLRRPRPYLRAFAVSVLAAATVVACDAGDDSDATDATAPTTAGPRPRGTDSESGTDRAPSTAPSTDPALGADVELTLRQQARAGLGLVPELVQAVSPSVVAISVQTTAQQQGEGSGVIVDDGLVVTNNHVVAGAADVTVILADGTRLAADIVATDAFTDLALLGIDREGLPVAELSDEYPEIGELAVVLGNPLGFENTVTAGIISGLGRSIPGAANEAGQALVDLVQTDAAISPGNSGGALVGADGRILGINVAYIPPAVGAVNLGFAIPAPTVIDVVQELLEDGTAEHAYVGLQLATVTQQLGAAAERGVAVLSVEPGAPAAEAGLQPGDVITRLDGTSIDDLGGFLTALRRYDPGDTAELTVVRNGETLTGEITMGTRPVQ